MKRFDNGEGLRCQAECWGETPDTLLVNEDDDTLCGDCEHIIATFDGAEVDHDPAVFRDAGVEAMGVERRTDKQFYGGY